MLLLSQVRPLPLSVDLNMTDESPRMGEMYDRPPPNLNHVPSQLGTHGHRT